MNIRDVEDMNILKIIKTRRSTRNFKEKQIQQELLDQIIEAARYAPSGGNNQSSHFIVIQNKQFLDELANIAQVEFSNMEVTEDMYKSLKSSILQSKKGNYVFHYLAPVLVVVCNKKGYGNAMADSACAIENMLIMANALDLGSCYINQLTWLSEHEVIRNKLNLNEDEVVCGAVAIGYPNTIDGLPNRQPLERMGNKVSVIE